MTTLLSLPDDLEDDEEWTDDDTATAPALDDISDDWCVYTCAKLKISFKPEEDGTLSVKDKDAYQKWPKPICVWWCACPRKWLDPLDLIQGQHWFTRESPIR
jgi:hypothetical protein